MNSGIYKIENLVNSKVYIGKSKDLKQRRYYHYNKLKNNRHPNQHLHNAYNTYGEDNFKWEIINKANSIQELNELL